MTADFEALTAGLTGLSAAEVERRRAAGQANEAAAHVSRSYLRILRDNAVTPIYLTLYAISIVLVGLGLYRDALMTAGLVLVNVAIGAFQEGRAKRRLDRISLLVRPHATVVRDGVVQDVQPQDIVFGDLVVLAAGDEVQVDGVILREHGFSADESLLTGESDPVRKHVDDRVFSGSFATAGSAVFEADRVGAASMAHQITLKARTFRNLQTPLQKEVSLALFAMALLVTVLGVSTVLSFLDRRGELPLEDSVRSAAVMVALVPQGLTFMVTLTYAMAALRIAGTGALVQRMNAVESMSHIDVLCTDKTGTLTTNQLRFDSVRPFAIDEPELRRLLALVSASTVLHNRTSQAIEQACSGEALPARVEVPFDSSRKWSGLAFDQGNDAGLYVLGAPEVVAQSLASDPGWQEAAARWSEGGLRVLMFARRRDLDALDVFEAHRLPDRLEALGLVALRDELRPEARETVAHFGRAGITLKVLSGDNPETVAALARQTGIASDHLASGPQLDELDDDSFRRLTREATIFGRISPDHKERLLEALQADGHYVAMIGDGVNDIPALKQANVSVAMRSGSPATRQIADIVLINDSFSVLPAAFQEGQRIRNGMQSILRPFLIRALAMGLVIFGAALLGDEFPTTPPQAGLPATFTVGIPGLVLALIARPGRTPNYLLPASLSFLLPASILMALAGLGVYHGFLQVDGDLERSRTALSLTLVSCGALLLPYVSRTTPARGLAGPDWRLAPLAAAMIACMLLVIAIGPLERFFELQELPAEGYGAVVLAVVAWAVALHLAWVVGGRLPWPQSLRERLSPLPAAERALEAAESRG